MQRSRRAISTPFHISTVSTAEAAARDADVGKPFGGVPIGVKELESVEGWPDTHACVVYRDQIATYTGTNVARAREIGGAVLAGQTTASEFGGVNVTRTVLNGTTHNPWQHGRTPGGSSGGTAAAVAGGLVTLGTGGDGGGSIRIPAGFVGMVGLKATYGRIPLTPKAGLGAMTVTHGCLSRSVRDTARWFDVCNGHDPASHSHSPASRAGRPDSAHISTSCAASVWRVVPDWGAAVVSPVMWELLEEAAVAADRRLRHGPCRRPRHRTAPDGSRLVGRQLGRSDRSAAGPLARMCRRSDAGDPDRSMETAPGLYGADARIKLETRRTELNEAMARIFDVAAGGVDFVITASNPDVAFDADGPLPNTFGGVKAGAKINGRLTFPANLYGNPAISIPSGLLDGLPIGLQVNGRHFSEELLLDLALTVERNRPWPLTTRAATGGVVKLGAFSVSLAVADLDASRRFYETLGFEVTGGDADENWLIMVNGETVIGLFHGMFDENILTFNPGLTQHKEQTTDFTDVRDVQAAAAGGGYRAARRDRSRRHRSGPHRADRPRREPDHDRSVLRAPERLTRHAALGASVVRRAAARCAGRGIGGFQRHGPHATRDGRSRWGAAGARDGRGSRRPGRTVSVLPRVPIRAERLRPLLMIERQPANHGS